MLYGLQGREAVLEVFEDITKFDLSTWKLSHSVQFCNANLSLINSNHLFSRILFSNSGHTIFNSFIFIYQNHKNNIFIFIQHKRSVSSLTEDLYKKVLINNKGKASNIISPIARKYKGILGTDNIDNDEQRLEYLEGKHLW